MAVREPQMEELDKGAVSSTLFNICIERSMSITQNMKKTATFPAGT